VEYFGSEHLPFALLALTVLVLLVVLPMLLLFLYPLRCFQRLLNRLHLNSHALRTFMDVFQGTFKDGTNGTRDYRSFSGLLLLSGLVLCGTFSWTLSSFYYPVATIFILLYCVLFIIFQPYKRHCHNYITIAMGTAFLCTYLGLIINIETVAGVSPTLLGADQGAPEIFLYISIVIMWTGAFIPLVYLLGLVSVVIYKRMAGFFIALDSLPVWLRWIKYLSLFRYALEASSMAVCVSACGPSLFNVLTLKLCNLLHPSSSSTY